MNQAPKPQRLGYLLKQAQHTLRREMDNALRPLELSVSKYAVLSELHGNHGLTNAELARRAFITPQSMQGILSSLEAAGLIERGKDVNHGRKLPLSLTESGLELVRRADAVAHRIEAKLEQMIAPLERKQVADLLERFCGGLSDEM